MFVKPAPDRKVRIPRSRDFLPAAGAEVPDTSYWHRRVRDADVVLADPEPEAAPEPDTKPAAGDQAEPTPEAPAASVDAPAEEH